tara:strand:- start:1523 stop:1978 length:456 start_codon:yes stop_codon:yes gene_type:complete
LKKSDFKDMIKESIKEVLIEEGLLATVISEVAREFRKTTPPTPAASKSPPPEQRVYEEVAQAKERAEKSRAKLADMRKNMMESIGKSSYKDIYNLNGVNLFEGTTPLASGGNPGSSPSPAGSLSDVEPTDPGIDISSLVGNAGIWKELLKK